jgi:hypothetical protein
MNFLLLSFIQEKFKDGTASSVPFAFPSPFFFLIPFAFLLYKGREKFHFRWTKKRYKKRKGQGVPWSSPLASIDRCLRERPRFAYEGAGPSNPFSTSFFKMDKRSH